MQSPCCVCFEESEHAKCNRCVNTCCVTCLQAQLRLPRTKDSRISRNGRSVRCPVCEWPYVKYGRGETRTFVSMGTR